MKRSRLALGSSVLLFLALASALVGQAATAIVFPFTLTYNCPEANERTPGWPSFATDCTILAQENISGDGLGNYEQFTSAANYPAGAGGRGERHWIGPGKNRHTNPVEFRFYNSPQKELWLRWYVRYEPNTRVNPGYGTNPATGDSEPLMQKMLYFGFGTPFDHVLYMNESHWSILNNGTHIATGGRGWWDLTSNPPVNSPPVPLADGSWHCLEYHYKMQTSGANGIGQLWVDGVNKIDRSNLTWVHNGTGWDRLGTSGNTQGMIGIPGSPGIGGYRPIFEDIDDWAVSSTGRIGCLSGGPQPPASPLNVRVIR